MRSLLCIVALAFCAVALADTAFVKDKPAKDDLSGLWEAHGVAHDDDENGKPYASLVIFKRINDGYVVQFTGGPGNNIVGIAVREGDAVSIAWSGSALRTGVSLYKMDGAKAMTGKWMALPRCTWENETMKYIGPAPTPKKEVGT